MIIRPVEVQGVVQRSQDMGQIKQNEDAKGYIDQTNIQTTEQKANELRHETVVQQENADKKQDKYDAKEKGNGEYLSRGQKRRKEQKEEREEGKVILKSTSGFDVKI